MTNISLHAPEQSSQFNGSIASILMVAIIVLSGFLSLAVYSA